MQKRFVEKYLETLEKEFEKYKKKLVNKKIGVLVSGGIDSSIIAHFVCQHFPSAVLISLQSEKSVDDDFVQILSTHLQIEPVLAQVTKDDFVQIKTEIISLLEGAKVDPNPMQVALSSVYYLLFKRAQKLGISYIFTGQGPDILLGGYHKYRQLTGEILKTTIKNDLPLLKIDQKRDNAMAQRWQLQTINPYLEKKVVDFCLTVPGELLIYKGQEKYLSRLLGKKLNLPSKIVERPKHAMQYSTGVSKLIK